LQNLQANQISDSQVSRSKLHCALSRRVCTSGNVRVRPRHRSHSERDPPRCRYYDEAWRRKWSSHCGNIVPQPRDPTTPPHPRTNRRRYHSSATICKDIQASRQNHYRYSSPCSSVRAGATSRNTSDFCWEQKSFDHERLPRWVKCQCSKTT